MDAREKSIVHNVTGRPVSKLRGIQVGESPDLEHGSTVKFVMLRLDDPSQSKPFVAILDPADVVDLAEEISKKVWNHRDAESQGR